MKRTADSHYTRRITVTFATILALASLASVPAIADDSRPILIDIIEVDTSNVPATYSGTVKVATTVGRSLMPSLVFPRGCSAGPPRPAQTSDAIIIRRNYACAAPIASESISLDYPGTPPALAVIFRVGREGGATHPKVMAPGTLALALPAEATPGNVIAEYTWLGMTHIWLGVDHLLFVTCLLFIARTPRRIFVTITGFTVAHSITLALAALSLVRLPVAAVEAVIALSILFLALEIARPNPDSWTLRYPVSVSASFGLLHGFGFASALQDVGLPEHEVAASLLFFNVGVEIGQVLFIGILLVLAIAGHTIDARLPTLVGPVATPVSRSFVPVATYAIGGVASFWLINRVAAFWF
jgi:hypothetical protein